MCGVALTVQSLVSTLHWAVTLQNKTTTARYSSDIWSDARYHHGAMFHEFHAETSLAPAAKLSNVNCQYNLDV